MKIINTRLHGVMDYVVVFFLLLPWMTDFYTDGVVTRIFAILGGLTITVSLITDYEFGLVKLLPMKGHLVFDVLSALLLISIPWIFPAIHFAFYWPVVLGAAGLLIVLFSSATPYRYTNRDIDITKP